VRGTKPDTIWIAASPALIPSSGSVNRGSNPRPGAIPPLGSVVRPLCAWVARPDRYTVPSPVARGRALVGQLIPLPYCVSHPSFCHSGHMLRAPVRAHRQSAWAALPQWHARRCGAATRGPCRRSHGSCPTSGALKKAPAQAASDLGSIVAGLHLVMSSEAIGSERRLLRLPAPLSRHHETGRRWSAWAVRSAHLPIRADGPVHLAL
jgi:hypothetical protein